MQLRVLLNPAGRRRTAAATTASAIHFFLSRVAPLARLSCTACYAYFFLAASEIAKLPRSASCAAPLPLPLTVLETHVAAQGQHGQRGKQTWLAESVKVRAVLQCDLSKSSAHTTLI